VLLVTLGGCQLLDGLVACDSVEAREKLVRCSKGGFMRGIVLTPWESQRATLVERVIELPLLFRVGSYGARRAGLAGDAN
jgi:hypothetical protein